MSLDMCAREAWRGDMRADMATANQARGDSEGAKGGESVGVAARLFSLYNFAVVLIIATGASFYQVPSSCPS
jgi:hypothetical protein